MTWSSNFKLCINISFILHHPRAQLPNLLLCPPKTTCPFLFSSFSPFQLQIFSFIKFDISTDHNFFGDMITSHWFLTNSKKNTLGVLVTKFLWPSGPTHEQWIKTLKINELRVWCHHKAFLGVIYFISTTGLLFCRKTNQFTASGHSYFNIPFQTTCKHHVYYCPGAWIKKPYLLFPSVIFPIWAKSYSSSSSSNSA